MVIVSILVMSAIVSHAVSLKRCLFSPGGR